ncbi:MAG TPA: acyloxyacyl hydrolase [Hyphomicrobiaceae bacterium]|nr:acyloxyacyl hydrolase [Hyphomicrobiaceae bacterium]
MISDLTSRVRRGLLLAVAAPVLATTAMPAAAQGLVSEIKVGALYHDPGDLWSGFRREPQSVDLNLELLLAPHWNVLGGTLRPAIGGSINFEGGTSKAYLDARWEIEAPSGIFFSIGLGAAIHDGNIDPIAPDKKALGSRVLFHIPAEIGWRWDGRNSISVFFDHVSNGYTQDYNEGLDSFGVRYGYRF